MARAIEIRKLQPEDRFVMFSSGDGASDRHFRHYASKLQFDLNLVATFVALEDHVFSGYVAISAAYVEKRDPRPKHTAVIRVPRIVASDDGVYDELLRFAMVLTTRREKECKGMIVDVPHERVDRFVALGFEPIDDVREGRIHGRAMPMFIDRATLETAFA